ncbi:hypothetical protein JCM19045_3132 [Bacillus sp. JCM 19045]|nr:hypothetical protein JCM19045_3132 [Bacillus sp. JCM 19045]
MIKEYLKVWNARKWMKQTEPFLQTWHAHLGYSLNLFQHFKKKTTVEQVARKHQLDEVLLNRWVEVGLAVGHLAKKRGNKIKTERKMITYLTKESKQSVGILLEEMFELHIPTLMSYRDLIQKDDKEKVPGMADMVAETSSLLETLTLPKVASVLKKHRITSVLDVGCGYGGYLKKLADKFPKVQFDGIEVDQEVCTRAVESNHFQNVKIEQGDFYEIQPQKPYQAVMLNNILYYFSATERLAMIKRASAVMKKNGVLILISPLANGKHGKRFASAFNSFMSAHEDMHPLPSKKEIVRFCKQAGLELQSEKPVVREGGWYMLTFQKKGK